MIQVCQHCGMQYHARMMLPPNHWYDTYFRRACNACSDRLKPITLVHGPKVRFPSVDWFGIWSLPWYDREALRRTQWACRLACVDMLGTDDRNVECHDFWPSRMYADDIFAAAGDRHIASETVLYDDIDALSREYWAIELALSDPWYQDQDCGDESHDHGPFNGLSYLQAYFQTAVFLFDVRYDETTLPSFRYSKGYDNSIRRKTKP